MFGMAPKTSSEIPQPALGTVIGGGTYELVEVLGVGGYGVVYRAEERLSTSSPRSFAIKCLIHNPHHPHAARQRQHHIREIALHQLASTHPNVVTLHQVIEESPYTYLVMDYAPDHDLFTQILNGCRYLGNDGLIKHVFLQLLDAVEFCHALSIFHRDLKPENVLCFDGGLRVAITDFGLATTDHVSEEFRTGSIYHMSPECHGGEFGPTRSYSPMFNDIWSLGIILLNLATGRNPWKSASLSDPTFNAYCRNPNGFLPTVLPISAELNAVVIRMLEIDWRKRITLLELRDAIDDIDFFYSEGVVFDGSMARCPWEVGMDIDGDSSSSDAPAPGEPTQSNLKSVWSADSASDMIFARPSSTLGTSAAASWTACSSDCPSRAFTQDEGFGFEDDLFTRPRTPVYPPSLLTPSESSPSLPKTPDALRITYPPFQRTPVLRIDTACCQQQGVQPFIDSMSVVSYVTATSSATNPYAPSSMYLSAGHGDDESADIKASFSVIDDKSMSSPSVWESSPSHATSSSSSSGSSSIQCDIPSPIKEVPPLSAPLPNPPPAAKKRLEVFHVFQRSRSPSPAPSQPQPDYASISRQSRRRPYIRSPMHWLGYPMGKIFSAGAS